LTRTTEHQLNLESINPTVWGWLAGLCVLGLIRYLLNRRK